MVDFIDEQMDVCRLIKGTGTALGSSSFPDQLGFQVDHRRIVQIARALPWTGAGRRAILRAGFDSPRRPGQFLRVFITKGPWRAIGSP